RTYRPDGCVRLRGYAGSCQDDGVPRGKRWDSLTLCQARRRRHMHRQLAALDRWYAEQAFPDTRGGDGRRRFLVATTTVVIGLLATGHLLHSQGYDLGLDGVHARRG